MHHLCLISLMVELYVGLMYDLCTSYKVKMALVSHPDNVLPPHILCIIGDYLLCDIISVENGYQLVKSISDIH